MIEQGAAEIKIDARLANNVELGGEVLRHDGRAPTKLHEVDVLAVAFNDVGEVSEGQTLVDNHRHTDRPRLGHSRRQQ